MAYERPYDTNGLMQWPAAFIPANENIKAFMVDSYDVHGGPQIFTSVENLIDFHPFKMKVGMSATLLNYPTPGTDTTFKLNTDPGLIVDLTTETTLVTTENFRDYWDEAIKTKSSTTRIYQYAPDYNGGIPPFPYSTDNGIRNEDTWDPQLNRASGHKWLRFRDNDDSTVYEHPDTPGLFLDVYDNWTVPLPIGNSFESGDYIDYQYRRETIAIDPITVEANLILDAWYVVEVGFVTKTDDANAERIFYYGKGAYFVHESGYTVVFTPDADSNPAQCQRVPNIPARTLPSGAPNNNPSLWEDTPPTPVDPLNPDDLWRIYAQKDIYGALKSEWILERIVEDAEYTRYSALASPLPETLCPTTVSVTEDPAGPEPTYDSLLTTNGWATVFDDTIHVFIATRADATEGVPGPPFTTWVVSKLTEESGEYIDNVFKKFPVNTDYDDVVLGKPIARNPSNEGWFDVPNDPSTTADDTEIWYVSQARKFFDGTLKSVWSDPVPYTAEDVFQDVVRAPDGLQFKYDPNDPSSTDPIPAFIRLNAELYRGLTALWKNVNNTIAFKWEVLFNNGAEINPPTEIVSNNDQDNAYLKLATTVAKTGTVITTGTAVEGTSTVFTSEFVVGEFIKVSSGQIREITVITDNDTLTVKTPFSPDVSGETIEKSYMSQEEADEGYLDNQILVINPAYVTGKIYIRCTQTFTTAEGPIEFIEIIDIIDISDGKDAKALEISAETQIVYWDGAVFIPNEITLTALSANLTDVTTFTWYWNNAGVWTKITGAEANYALAGAKNQQLQIEVDDGAASLLFAQDGTAEYLSFAVSTHATDPLLADWDTDFSDYKIIAKSGAPSAGTDGESAAVAILSQEAYTGVLDPLTGVPESGTFGTTGNAQTDILVFKGDTQLDYDGGQFTIAITKREAGALVSAASGDVQFVKRTSPVPPAVSDFSANVYCSQWNNGLTNRTTILNVEITITASGEIITKEFSLASTLDAPGAQLLEVTSDKGFVFDRVDLADKTFTATLWQVQDAVQEEIDLTNIYTQYRDGVGGVLKNWTQGVAGKTYVYSRSQVFLNNTVEVRMSDDGGSNIIAVRSFTVSDITDGRTYRMYEDAVTKPPNPNNLLLTSYNSGTLPGDWAKTAQAGVRWAVDGHENTGDPITIIWEGVYAIGEEAGSQGATGESGGFLLQMYLDKVPPPPTVGANDTLATMLGNGWKYKTSDITLTGDELMWMTQQLWDSDDGGSPVTFDGTGAPSNGDAGAKGFWQSPVQLTPTAPADPDPTTYGVGTEIRFAKNTSNVTPPSLSSGSRSPSGWTVAPPSRAAGEYIWATVAQIDSFDDSLIGTWSAAVVWSGDKGDDGGLWDEAWQELNASFGIWYRKTVNGEVHLKKIGNAVMSTTAFGFRTLGTLPASHYPASDVLQFIDMNTDYSTAMYITVDDGSGIVTIVARSGLAKSCYSNLKFYMTFST